MNKSNSQLCIISMNKTLKIFFLMGISLCLPFSSLFSPTPIFSSSFYLKIKNYAKINRKRKQNSLRSLVWLQLLLWMIFLHPTTSSWEYWRNRYLCQVENPLSTPSFTSNNLYRRFAFFLLSLLVKERFRKVKRGFKAVELLPTPSHLTMELSVKVNKVFQDFFSVCSLSLSFLYISLSRIFDFDWFLILPWDRRRKKKNNKKIYRMV